MSMRLLTNGERGLLSALLQRAGILEVYKDQLDDWLVEDMDDSGMGSIRLHRKGVLIENTEMDRKASELQFRDVDGTLVIASLNLNSEGFPFEIDLWKVNSEPLQVIPDGSEFTDVQYTIISDNERG
jgi:hypothetical protein